MVCAAGLDQVCSASISPLGGCMTGGCEKEWPGADRCPVELLDQVCSASAFPKETNQALTTVLLTRPPDAVPRGRQCGADVCTDA